MKLYLVSLILTGLATGAAIAEDRPDITDTNQLYNYAFGMDVISSFKQFKVDIDIAAFTAGMRDAINDRSKLTPEEKKAAMDELSRQMAAQAEVELKAVAARNLQEGEIFMAANGKKDGVQVKKVVAPDGSEAEFQYRILKSGPPGPSPNKSDVVEVHYVGSVIDGTVFDSSVKRNIPATFAMDNVLPAWAEALQIMKAGDTWELFIPPKLSFGEAGLPQIGSGNTVIFQLELISFYTPERTPIAATNAPMAAIK